MPKRPRWAAFDFLRVACLGPNKCVRDLRQNLRMQPRDFGTGQGVVRWRCVCLRESEQRELGRGLYARA